MKTKTAELKETCFYHLQELLPALCSKNIRVGGSVQQYNLQDFKTALSKATLFNQQVIYTHESHESNCRFKKKVMR